jgi:hypothetical protein
MKNIAMNIKVNEYTSRVLGVIKEKYGLKDKGQALDKFTDLFGSDFIDKEVKEQVIKDVILSCEKHIIKYGKRTRTKEEIRKAIEGK